MANQAGHSPVPPQLVGLGTYPRPSSSSESPNRPGADRSASHELDDDSNSADHPSKKRKSTSNGNIQSKSISCTECKRRKIKCSRFPLPCEACIRRGKSSVCAYEDPDHPPPASAVAPAPPQPSTAPTRLALTQAQINEDHERRLVHIEKFLQTVFAGNGGPSMAMEAVAAYEGPRSVASVASGADDGVKFDQAAEELEDEAFTTEGQGPAVTYPFFAKGVPTARNTAVPPRASLAANDPNLIPESLTSITRRPLTGNKLFIAAHFGLDCLSESSHLEEASNAACAQLLAQIPSRAVSDFLVERFFHEGGIERVAPGWLHSAVPEQLFMPEHGRFWEMMEQGRALEVDPAWMSVWLLMLALTLSDLRYRLKSPFEPVLIQLGLNDAADGKPQHWSAMAQRLLVLGDVHGTPQVRTVQAVSLLGQILQSHPGPGQTSSFLTWLACATSATMILGWHRLGDKHDTMPPDDPALPPGKNSMKRETVLRLFMLIRFMDSMSAGARHQSYFIHDSQVNTAPPSNVHRSEISLTEWRLSPKARTVLTDGSFDWAKFAIGRLARLTMSTLAEPGSLSYQSLLDLDREFIAMKEQGSRMWTQANHNALYDRWRRHVCQEGVTYRIMRIHRPFLARGYVDPKYAYSTQACLQAAKTVISSHHGIRGLTESAWFPWSHVLSAAIVCFVDLFQAIDTDLTDAILEEKKQVLVLASDLFSCSDELSLPLVRATVAKGAKVISGLFLAASMRRARRAGGGKTDTPESFTQVLQRITKDVGRARADHHSHANGTMAALFKERSNSLATAAHHSQPHLAIATGLSPSSTGQASAGSFSSPSLDSFSTEFLDSLGLADPSVSLPAGNNTAYDFWAGGLLPQANDAGNWLPLVGMMDSSEALKGAGQGQIEMDSTAAALFDSLGLSGGLVGGSQGL